MSGGFLMMMWSARVSAELVECKRLGLDFESSWERAVEIHPPMRRDLGAAQQTLDVGGDPRVEDVQEEPLVDFFRRAARDAWFGRRPVLAHLGHLMELLEDVEQAAAGRTFGPRPASRRPDRLVA